MINRLMCQRGALHLIAVIPLSFSFFDPRLLGALAGGALVGITATLARHWWLNLVGLLSAALIAYLAGYRIEFITNPDGGFFYLQRWSWLITLVWIVMVSQGVCAIGQLEPSGKLLTKILIISGSALVFISFMQGHLVGVMLLSVLLMIVLILRKHEVPAERWSQAVGYGLALAAIVGLVKTTASLALLAPLIALGLPLTGTLSIVYSHKIDLSWLDELQIGQRNGLVLLYLFSAYGSVLAFLGTRLKFEVLALIAGVTGIFLGLLVRGIMRLAQTETDAKRFTLLGTPIECVTLDEAVQRIENLIRSGTSALVCTPDTTAVLRAQRDHKLRDIYQRADLVTPDGTGIVWAGRLLGAPMRERVSGIDLLERLFAKRAGAPLRVFFLGAAPGVAELAAQKLSARYPNLQVVGTHHGYFQDDERVLELIKRAQPEIVLVGLGVPRQELWMHANCARLAGAVLIGVGGCFDVWSGRVKRAPLSWQRLGLEWLYRVLQEPRRLIRVSTIPLFVGQVYLTKIARLLCD